MRIGFVYDTKEDYGYESGNLDFTDFVSLHTVSQISSALERYGFEVAHVGNLDKLKALLAKNDDDIDLFFNISEGIGSRNREALVPALLEAYGRPYTASDAYAMSIAMNKQQTKLLVQTIGVPSPVGITFEQVDDRVKQQMGDIGFPAILKPNAEGGSMGLHVVNSVHDVERYIDFDMHIKGQWLLERYVPGSEITVPVLGNGDEARALGVVATIYEDGTNIDLYGSDLKYIDNVINTLDFECPDRVKAKIMEYSVAVHRYFNLNDYSRMDFRLSENFEPYFLEANLMPSLCRNGSFEVCGAAMGLEYHEVVGSIVDVALKRWGLIGPPTA